MGDGVELEAELAEGDPLPLGDGVQRAVAQAVLAQFRLDEGEGQTAAVDGDVRALAQQIGHPADVVLVPVGEHQRHHVVEAVGELVQAREDQVDAGLALLGEEHAAVDDEDLPVELETGHVAPHIAETAERGDAQGVGLQLGRGLQTVVCHGGQPSGPPVTGRRAAAIDCEP